MFIPLSIDSVATSKRAYFATDAKMGVMFGVLFTYFILMIFVMQNTTQILVPVALLTFMYIVLLYYMARFYMFEESRLKRTVEELDKNKVVSPNHFNAVQNVTTEGMIKYQYELEIKFALVVYVQRGSKVGVPEGFMEEQVEVLNSFIGGIHRQGWDYDRYEMTKESEVSDILRHSSNRLLTVDSDLLKMFHKLQVEALQVYSTGETSEIVDYYVIYNTKPATLHTFMDIVEEMVQEHFSQSQFFSKVNVLDKRGVENFFKRTIMLDNFDLQNVKRTVEMTDLEDFATISRVFDQYGEEVVEIEGGEERKVKENEDVHDMVNEDIERERRVVEAKEKEYFSRRRREHTRLDKMLINNETFAYEEYKIFSEIFKEGDIQYLSAIMDEHYNNWKKHKIKHEVEDEEIELEEYSSSGEEQGINLMEESYGNSEVSYELYEDDEIDIDEDDYDEIELEDEDEDEYEEEEEYDEDEIEIDDEEIELEYGFLDGERVRK